MVKIVKNGENNVKVSRDGTGKGKRLKVKDKDNRNKKDNKNDTAFDNHSQHSENAFRIAWWVLFPGNALKH